MGFCIANLILPTEAYVLKLDVASLACNLDRLLLDVVPLTVLNVDVVNLSIVLKTIEESTILRLLTGNVLNIHIADCWNVTTLSYLGWLIDQIDAHNSLAALTNLDVANEDVLVDTTTTGVGLDAEHTVKVR